MVSQVQGRVDNYIVEQKGWVANFLYTQLTHYIYILNLILLSFGRTRKKNQIICQDTRVKMQHTHSVTINNTPPKCLQLI